MKNHRPLGVSSSLLLGLLGNDFPEDALSQVAAAGVTATEYFSSDDNGKFRDDAHLRRFAAAAHTAGIRLWSVHAPFDGTDISQLEDAARAQSLDNVTRAMDVAVGFAAPLVVLHGSREPVEDAERAARLDCCRASLDELCLRADERNLSLAIETLPRSCLGNRVAELIALVDSVDGDLGICFDVNHVALYEAVKPSLLAVGPRLRTVHISDCDGENERHWIPGRGNTDWAGFIEGLDELGYDGPLMHEAMDRDADLAQNATLIAAAARELLHWEG